MKRLNFKWMAVLATALTIGFASCGDGGEEDDATGMVTVTIDNLSGSGALSLYSTKPVQWKGLDGNAPLAWGTLSDYKPETQLYAGSAGSFYTGGDGYIIAQMAAPGPYNTYVSKQKHTLKKGNNKFNFTTDFEILHEYNGEGTVVVRNMHPAVDYVSTLDIYVGSPSEDTWVAGMGASGIVGYHRDFLAMPLFNFAGNRYTGTQKPVLVIIFIGFDGEPHSDFVFYNENGKQFYAGWYCDEVSFTNGRAEIDWNDCKILPTP